jgi:hypothetical protein
MKRLIVLGFVAVVLATTTGCGKDPDSLTKESISQMNDLSTAIEKKESIDTIKSLAEKYKATNEKIAALKLSPEDAKKLMEKYQKEQLEAFNKMVKAVMGNPEAMSALTAMGGLGSGFQVSSTSSTSFGPSTDSTPGPVGGSGGHARSGRK